MISSVTKYKPVELFFNNNESKSKEVNFNMKQSQKIMNNKLNPIPIYEKILIINTYKKIGNCLKPKLGKKGIYIIPLTVVSQGNSNSYKVCRDKSYYELAKNEIYNIDFKLLKEVNIIAYNEYLKNDYNDFNLNNIEIKK